MSNHQSDQVTISMPEVITEDSITFYIIIVNIGDVQFKIRHRYSSFETLHSRLVEEGFDKDKLPPKKLIGNKDPAFIMKRRRDLETYLKEAFHFFANNLPQTLAEFLDFPKYDIHYVVQTLASQFFEIDLSDTVDSKPEQELDWSPLELFSVCERLKIPCPPMNTDEKKFDFTNVVDMCCRLKKMSLTGSEDKIGSSQIVPNRLKIDFLAFKSLTQLHLKELNICSDTISSLGILRNTLQILSATNCNLNSVSQLLLCDVIHSEEELPSILTSTSVSSTHTWSNLLKLDVSQNNLKNIDKSIRLAPSLTEVDFSSNSIEDITNLTGLPHLRKIDLSHNLIANIESLHTKIGQILSLKMNSNKIRNLHGMSKLYSVMSLDVSENKLRTLADVSAVTNLPCIENLVISPNKVNNEVDYRLKILEGYGSRCGEVNLDKQETSQAEIDKVSVLMALRVAKEGKPPTSLFGNLPSSREQDLN